jgi:hypothetical protein
MSLSSMYGGKLSFETVQLSYIRHQTPDTGLPGRQEAEEKTRGI